MFASWAGGPPFCAGKNEGNSRSPDRQPLLSFWAPGTRRWLRASRARDKCWQGRRGLQARDRYCPSCFAPCAFKSPSIGSPNANYRGNLSSNSARPLFDLRSAACRGRGWRSVYVGLGTVDFRRREGTRLIAWPAPSCPSDTRRWSLRLFAAERPSSSIPRQFDPALSSADVNLIAFADRVAQSRSLALFLLLSGRSGRRQSAFPRHSPGISDAFHGHPPIRSRILTFRRAPSGRPCLAQRFSAWRVTFAQSMVWERCVRLQASRAPSSRRRA